MGIAVREMKGVWCAMLRLCLLRFKHQLALKTYSVEELMTARGSLRWQSVISLAVDRWEKWSFKK